MGRKDLEEFKGKKIARIFIAKKVSEAETVENILTENNIDYAIEIEPYYTPSPMQTPANGVAFYVILGQSDYCRHIISEIGFKSGIVFV